jgi:hypothetical protein
VNYKGRSPLYIYLHKSGGSDFDWRNTAN